MSAADSKLYPVDLVKQIRGQSQEDFMTRWRDVALLLVRIDDKAAELFKWLTSSDSSTQGALLVASRDGIGFNTGMTTLPKVVAALDATRPRRLATASSVLAELDRVSYYVAPLRKRGSEGKPFADRISVGRARNNDVVLRHASVSKFHAWFECDYDDVLFLNDAKSTNHTAISGRILQPGESGTVDIGAEVQFGDISCLVCSPKMVWDIASRV